MLRGCLFSLVLYVALSVGYFFWLDTVFEPPTSYWASALVGFIVLCCIGSLINSKNAFRDWSLVSAGRRGLRPRDGQLIAVSGEIHPIAAPLIAPFSGDECVICEYDLSRQKRETGSGAQENTGSDFTGFLMTPCVIRGPGGDVKLLGFPVIEGSWTSTHHSYAAARRAIDFLTTREFENRTGIKLVTLLSVFGDVWSDEDGHVEKNVRLGKVSLPELFPPELEAEIDRQIELALLKTPEEERDVDEDDPDDSNEDDDEFDDEDSLEEDLPDDGYAGPPVPQMTEKRVEIGTEVCVIGRYNELRGGLLPPRGSSTPNRLIVGTAEMMEKKSRSAIFSYLIGGLVALFVVHLATYFVMQMYSNSNEIAKFRQKEAFEAVDKGDVKRLERLMRRGMDINVRNPSGATLLMVAKDATMANWLIGRGADVNAVDTEGETALMKAAQAGRTDVVQTLIDAKADLNRRSFKYERSALMEAVDGNRDEVVALLRASGAQDDVITAASGDRLPADGGPQLVLVKTYLQAIRDENPEVLRGLFVKRSDYDFGGVDWKLWQRVRPARIETWTGFVRGDDATLTLSGPSGAGYPVTWDYQLKRSDGEWRVAREKQDYGGER